MPSLHLLVEVMGEGGTVARFGVVERIEGSTEELRQRAWAAYRSAGGIMREGAGMGEVTINSREHVEAWLQLGEAIRELEENANALIEEGVYDADTVGTYGLPEDLVGKRIKDAGLAPQIAEEFLPKIEEYAERLKQVVPPSPDAVRDYMLAELGKRSQRIEALLLEVRERQD